ncbi:UDP-N-acetylmuramate--L-alanine ligase [Wolbachia endosymbiont of Ctenocephalides felis wCfeT]|uniref:UDP-N-acetylmuramate--L-alanine ligase n=1 Tax=Wolbachia endosymbiont of Ctenocephalides felis wCfeT TaxID=2732593 RepID=UPI001447168C|nr:Mur ligase domain-containing protein [Wolbachia endosymbiont of Ctenocephalides felis wCfeT]
MNDSQTIHIIGIGGIGMSAIAEILHNSNYKVQGSDVRLNNNIERLQKFSIKVYIEHNADNIEQAQTVVYSSAIKPDNAELVAARESNKTVLHRSDILGEILKNKYVIAVSGSSGKTTTTAMIASIFDHSNRSLSATSTLSTVIRVADTGIHGKNLDSSVTRWNDTSTGIDATVIVGGILNSYQSNLKIGKSGIFLIEADESDGTMLKIPANIAVITSVNDDHIDHYGTFNDIKNAFSQFASKADFAILPDSSGINCNASNFITFGFEADAGIKAINIQQHSSSIEFDVLIDADECQSNWIPASSTEMTPFSLSSTATVSYNWIPASRAGMTEEMVSSQCLTLGSRMKQTALEYRIIKKIILSNAVGIHKVSNALAAISVALKLGISIEEIKKGLLEFKGVARRFSLIANINGVKFIEDYAHHPNEILATLTAARTISQGKVIGIIEPLRFARIRNFFGEFTRIFMMFNHIILTPVHPPEDQLIPGYGIDDIQKALIESGFNNVKLMNDSLLISHFINDSANPGDVVLFIGAGSNIARLMKETIQILT